MKLSMQTYIAITTFLLFVITILAALNYPFGIIFLLTVIGQVFLILMVYKVLTDNYKTDKTFKHFYQDKPIYQPEEELNYRK